MISNEKASLQVLKITIITLILVFTCGIAVRAFNLELTNAKIALDKNYDINVLTTKNEIEDILKQNHIVVLPDETVFQTDNLENEKVIKIAKVDSDENKILEIADSEGTISLEKVLGNYSNIVEKIEIVEEKIPYETITKNASTVSTEERTNKVLQKGKDGLKKVTYKVKYINDIEISRTVIKEEIIRKVVNEIVQVTKATSRSNDNNERTSLEFETETISSNNSLANKVKGIKPIVKTLNASAYTASTCGKKPTSKGYGITASGAKAAAWYTVAAGKAYPMGTVIYIPSMKNKPNGGWFVVQDRGGAISNGKLDIYMNTYNECIKFGRKNIECYIYCVK